MDQYRQGKFTRQAHKGIPEGHYEEEQGLKGFYGPVSHLIKKQPSTRWTSIDGPLKPRLFDLNKLKTQNEWQRILYNDHLGVYTLALSASANTDKAFRNADGDTLYFCHQGSGSVLTEYGKLEYKTSQYIVIPKCLMHTFVPKENSVFFIVENKSSHYEEPDRGPLGRHGLYDEEAIIKPDLESLHNFLKQENKNILEVNVKSRGAMTTFKYEESVYDVVGWKGDLYPFTLDTDHIMPINSHRAHLPPSAHTTFVAREFVICSFLPRPLETDKDALKVPFYHQNIDYDEVLFYHKGDFFSRDNLDQGMMSFHPQGFPHGPHPKAAQNIENTKETSELAVMLDSRQALHMDSCLGSVEDQAYWKSWQSK